MILENLRNEKGVKSLLPAHGRVGARATPLSSAAHFAEQKILNCFLLLQNTKSGGDFLKSEIPSPKPARIPPQTPPAGGKSAEATSFNFAECKTWRYLLVKIRTFFDENPDCEF